MNAQIRNDCGWLKVKKVITELIGQTRAHLTVKEALCIIPL
jgi:hypothetical protein